MTPNLSRSLFVAALLALPAAALANSDSFWRIDSGTVRPGPIIGGGLRPVFRARLHCAVRGTPVEFPDDISIWSSTLPIPAGTVVDWSVPSSTYHGTVTLPALEPNRIHFLSGALGSALAAGTPCVINYH
ncbi:MAG: hypothetical protein KJZ59_11325 [Pararhodobacter sp.]|nr:hypothetical protein [Pararhodobacter sp.]